MEQEQEAAYLDGVVSIGTERYGKLGGISKLEGR